MLTTETGTPTPDVLCACGCGAVLPPATGRRPRKYLTPTHTLLHHRNSPRARDGAARTLALKRIDRWTQGSYDALLRQLGEDDALTRTQLGAIKVALAQVSRTHYQRGYHAGYEAHKLHVGLGRQDRRRTRLAVVA
jgi:hypothetical protein